MVVCAKIVACVVVSDGIGPRQELAVRVVTIPAPPQGEIRLLEHILRVRTIRYQCQQVTVNPSLMADEELGEQVVLFLVVQGCFHG